MLSASLNEKGGNVVALCLQVSVRCFRAAHGVGLHGRSRSTGGDQNHHGTVSTFQQHVHLQRHETDVFHCLFVMDSLFLNSIPWLCVVVSGADRWRFMLLKNVSVCGTRQVCDGHLDINRQPVPILIVLVKMQVAVSFMRSEFITYSVTDRNHIFMNK